MTATDGDVRSASALTIAGWIREGVVTSVAATEACLARIAEVNPVINAVVQLAPDAIAEAELADVELRAGTSRGPLHGVPFTVKDSLDTAGVISTAGTVAWRERVPERDATVVARLKAAGAILIGKTNTPEFTWSGETDNDVYGRTSNPYDPERTPGGSSGGPAAIVAASGSPFDIGSDTGDSIRHPAHACGIAGIKPTSGRVPRTGHWPSFRGLLENLTQLGPMARRVEDLALILPIIAGPDGEDPHVVPVSLRDPGDVRVDRLRAAFFVDNGIMTPTAATAETVSGAAEALAAAGVRLTEEVPPRMAEAEDVWRRLIDADGRSWLQRLISAAGTPGRGWYEGNADWPVDLEPLPGDALSRLVETADDVRSSMLHWIQGFDLIVCPVMPQPAIRHGESNEPWFGDTYSDVHNLTGWPAAVVRAGTSPEGLPIGVQLIARPWREDVALAAAAVVEAATGGWQPPPI